MSGRLYDAFGRIDQFKLVVFASNLVGDIKARLQTLDSYLASSRSFHQKYADVDLFKIVVVVRSTPSQAEARIRTTRSWRRMPRWCSTTSSRLVFLEPMLIQFTESITSWEAWWLSAQIPLLVPRSCLTTFRI